MYNGAQMIMNNTDNSNKIFNGYNKRESKNETVDRYFYDNFDNRNHKEYCLTDCARLCSVFSEKGECISNCKKVLLSLVICPDEVTLLGTVYENKYSIFI